METALATQLITAGSTLAGVVVTLLTTAFLERRRAQDTRALEGLRLASEHAKWLRDERQKAYTSLSAAGEEVHQFFRSELPLLVGAGGAGRREGAEARWHQLRTALRKCYNQVELLGTAEVRVGALEIWRTARNGGNDFLAALDASPDGALDESALLEILRATTSRLGTVGDRYLEACRTDLQGESSQAAD
jgi:hypothetical protein